MKLRLSETLTYIIPYILITTFQYHIAKDGLNYSSPLVLMGLRYLIASVILFGISRRFSPIINKDMIILSVCTCASAGLWALGLQYVSPAESAVISYTMPLFAIPLSIVIVGEKTARRGWCGAIVGFVGVMIYAIPLSRDNSTIIGGILTLGNAVFWAAYTVYYRKIRNQDRMMTIATQLLFASGFLFLGATMNYKLEYSSNLVFDVVYLSILNGVAQFYLWNGLARIQKISKMATLIYLVPATATLFDIVETQMLPSFLSIVGMCIMIFGIYLSRSAEQ
jgi:drug/metabolite transporter (DMT)-like permease